jgi:hypothetical protein
MGTLHKDQYTCLITCRSVLRKMRNVSDKRCRENQNTQFTTNNYFSKIVLKTERAFSFANGYITSLCFVKHFESEI